MQDQNKATFDQAMDNLNNITLQEEELRTDQADSIEDVVNTSGSATEPITEEKELKKLKDEVELYKDKYVRLFAEFDNYKRRNARERIELLQTAGKDIIVSLLDVLDDCDRAEKQIANYTDANEITEGVQLVFNKLRNTLQSKGLKPMESLNTDFDVEKHEAIAEVEVSEKSKKGKVVDEIVKGYYLNDKLIRFAKVVVGK